MRDELINKKRREFLGASAQALSGVVLVSSAMAASPDDVAVKEPAAIGYPNKKGLTIERVTYPTRNMGTTIVANLFKPAGLDANRKYAAVVVTHPFGGVKEQTSGLYAQHLAEQGFITLAYDASYQGESGGQPRLMEVPAQRLDDISCAIDFLVRLPQVDAARVGSLGICAGGHLVFGREIWEQLCPVDRAGHVDPTRNESQTANRGPIRQPQTSASENSAVKCREKCFFP